MAILPLKFAVAVTLLQMEEFSDHENKIIGRAADSDDSLSL